MAPEFEGKIPISSPEDGGLRHVRKQTQNFVCFQSNNSSTALSSGHMTD